MYEHLCCGLYYFRILSEDRVSLPELLCYALCSLINKDVSEETGAKMTSLSARTASLVLLALTFVLFNAYNAILISFLSVPSLEMDIQR